MIFLCKKRRTKMKEPETGKKENTGKSGYSITTWRLHLWCRHPEWLRTTQEFYNRIAEFYYNLLLDHTDLWEMGSQQTLRELEIMSIPGRGGRIPSDPLPWQKVPLYFRRAAANEGIASAKSYLSRFAQDEKIGRAEKLNAAVTYYKGMYQDFSAKEITLRVWTGDTWTWMHCRLSGRDFPENARLMSPSVVFEYKYDMLHVPVRQNNENTATVRQRMQAGCRILCIQFTNSDAFAAGVVLDGTGQEIAVKFWKGGNEYSHHCRKLLEKIQKSQEATGGRQTGRVDQKYWMHLKHLSEHYGHQVTSQILFDILFELEKRIDPQELSAFQGRFYGRVSEIIFNVWLDAEIKLGKIKKNEIKELPYQHMEKINWWKKSTAFLKAKFVGKRYEGSF